MMGNIGRYWVNFEKSADKSNLQILVRRQKFYFPIYMNSPILRWCDPNFIQLTRRKKRCLISPAFVLSYPPYNHFIEAFY